MFGLMRKKKHLEEISVMEDCIKESQNAYDILREEYDNLLQKFDKDLDYKEYAYKVYNKLESIKIQLSIIQKTLPSKDNIEQIKNPQFYFDNINRMIELVKQQISDEKTL